MEEAASLGMEPYGVELSEFGAARIAEKFGAGPRLPGPFDQAAFAGVDHDFFDVVTMFDFMEHVRDPSGAGQGLPPAPARRATRYLDPERRSLSRRLMGPRWLHYKVEHLFYFTPGV